ncbi:MAG: exodeoxyribonuclease VII small subunit [Lachnospiraceae bacterium]|nr:exodeoxyribonuclease VII small subunit [Lachnospiraceae bacterium]
MEEEKFNVDEALNRLEEINAELSNKDIELSKSMELYKEGVLLASKCKEHLEGVKTELQILNDN